MQMINAYDPANAGELGDADRELIRRRERLLGPAYRLFYARPLHLVRGDGVATGRDVRLVPAPDGYRGDPAVGPAFARGVTAALEEFRAAGIRPAMLIVDSIFSSDGVHADPPGFLQEAVDAVRAAGALYVADEVQAGFGRTGAAMWGFLRHGVRPDMVSMGKPMGNGHPVAGLAVGPELVRDFGARARYFNTFGGNPVSAAAAMAVLDVIEAEGIPARVAAVGAYLAGGLRRLAAEHAAIGDVRGAGLFMGVDLVTDRQSRAPDRDLATRVVNGLRERRVLISASGPGGNVLKIRPPLAFTTDNADLFLARLAETLTACRA